MSNKTKKAWFKGFSNDKYVIEAKKLGYRSRAAFKLLEIDEEFNLISASKKVLDIGAAPGSWSQVIQKKNKTLTNTSNIGVDLLNIVPMENVKFIKGDFQSKQVRDLIDAFFENSKIDLILSDMAPNLTGISVVDGANVIRLGELVLEFSIDRLSAEGNMVVKTFQSSGFTQLLEKYKKKFRRVKTKKPNSSKSDSSELFLIVSGLR